jgi:hypothetical protein
MVTNMNIESIRTRNQAMDFLEGYSFERKDELNNKYTKKGLVKSYLLETVPDFQKEPDVKNTFNNINIRLDNLDETLYKIWDTKQGKYFGFLEKLIQRHLAVYTMEESKDSDPWIMKTVNLTPELDRLWISGWTFEKLWQKVLEINPGKRYGRLSFEYQNIFEVDNEEVEENEETDNEDEQGNKSETYFERRASKFTMVEKLDAMKKTLPELQKTYSPLYSISQLRFPAVGKGGHDFYYNGKVTNRSDSFSDHRAHLLYVLKMYKAATEDTEQKAWYSMEKTKLQVEGSFTTLLGAPVVMKFKESLPTETLEKWISTTFQRKRNKFRLWGNPIYVGSNKFHIYGADRHLWQQIFLEITDKHVIAILPRGTCGNTIHRLVSNIQRYIDPGVNVWVGDQEYKDIISKAINNKGIKYES